MGLITLILQSGNGYTKVEYKTDISENSGTVEGNFTIMEIVGLNDIEKHRGLDFQQLPSNIPAFKAFAEAHNLRLSMVSLDMPEVVIADYTIDSSSSGGFGG